MSKKTHFLLVTFHAQGHINPALQFAKRLICHGSLVTFATSISAHRRITTKGPIPDGLSFAYFSDGHDDGLNHDDDLEAYMFELESRGSETLADLIATSKKEGRPFDCLIYTFLLPWVAKVAHGFHLPSVLLWIQPAAVFDIYYYYLNGYGDVIRRECNYKNSSSLIKLPGLPPLTIRDLPSFLIPSNKYAFAVKIIFQRQMDTLCEQTNPIILVNSFDALESEALKSIDRFKMIGIGPLIPSAFLDGKDPSDTSFGADLFQSSKKESYMQWLESKPESSVIYVSFGSISVLSKQQQEELARGLLDTDRPFLWVIRETKANGDQEEENKLIISCREELEEQGIIVPWCSQVEVLSHSSVGCFLTHCGWNSTLESLVCGVPMVAFPQWTDQGMNAKLIEETWKTGVRVTATNEEGGIVESEEIKKCLELVMGEKREELRRNAKEWKDLAKEVTKEGGSSAKNLKAFVEEIGQGNCNK